MIRIGPLVDRPAVERWPDAMIFDVMTISA